MKKFNIYTFFLLCLIFFPTTVFSQSTTIDSLENEIRNHKEIDTTKVNLLNSLSYNYSSFDIIKAREKAEEANSLAKQLNYKKGEAKSLLRFSNIHRKRSEMDEAENAAQKALKIYEEINNEAGINSAYVSLAFVAYYNNDPDKALEYYKKVLNTSIKNGDLMRQAQMLNNIGGVHYSKGNLNDALTFFKKSYAIREQLGEKELGIDALENIAVISLNQGRYREALEYFNQCLSIHRKNNNKEGIAHATYNMSAVYYELKQYEKTLLFLEESLKINKDLKIRSLEASCLINIGAVYSDLKDFPKALAFMTESLNISKEIDDIVELSAGNFQLGDLRLLMGQPEIALKNYNTCLELSSSIDDKMLMCHAHIGLASAYVALNNYSEALHHALEGGKIAKDLELLAQQKLSSGILATVYSKTGNYKKAFESHQEFKMINDSLFSKEKIEKIAQIEYEYKYKQQLDSASIRELSLTKTVQSTSQDLEKSQRNYLWAIIGVLLVSILLGGIIFYQKLRHEKSKTQNIVMEQKLLRSQMTPHFIFNSLSVLQGMILNKEEKKSVEYLSKFSKLLRITLENSRDKTVSLAEELAAIQDYLTLQNLENEVYKCTITVSESLDVHLFEVPPMLIQPFVENAIEHAFVNQKEDRKIDIRLTYVDKKLICTIADNGIGINTKPEYKKKDKKSLATTITSERLKVLSKDFKMQGSVTIEDRQKFNEQGTLVTLIIPHKLLPQQ